MLSACLACGARRGKSIWGTLKGSAKSRNIFHQGKTFSHAFLFEWQKEFGYLLYKICFPWNVGAAQVLQLARMDSSFFFFKSQVKPVATGNYWLTLSFGKVENSRNNWVIWDAKITLARLNCSCKCCKRSVGWCRSVISDDGYLSNQTLHEMVSI